MDATPFYRRAAAVDDADPAAAKRGDHQAAYEIWLPLAERGDMRAHTKER